MNQVDGHPTPLQYGEGKCSECGKPLSTYNRFTVCGPCRYKLSFTVAPAETAEVEGELTYTWNVFPERKPVRRGQLYSDTV